MNCRTYEIYDENEYFIKFLSIHPILSYSTKLVDIKKLEYQKSLLTLLTNKQITVTELIKKYSNILTIETKLKHRLSKVKYLNKQMEIEIEKNNNTQLIELFNSNIKN